MAPPGAADGGGGAGAGGAPGRGAMGIVPRMNVTPGPNSPVKGLAVRGPWALDVVVVDAGRDDEGGVGPEPVIDNLSH